MNNKKKVRTEEIGIIFKYGVADGLVFDVTEAFKESFDITYTRRIDKAKNAEKQKALGRKLEPNEKIFKRVLTRGDPPAYSFSEGYTFYEPAGVRAMKWGDALKVLRRTVQVIKAIPDPGAILTSKVADGEISLPEEPITAPETGGPGWVAFEICYYQSGKIEKREIRELSQHDFAEFLRTGGD
jgi:hypothetical protein